MVGVVVCGIQWGDEGKGKFADLLSEESDYIVRFQGGNNAGHTLVIDGKVYKLRSLPSGVVHGERISVIGNGVVLNPASFLEELAHLHKQGLRINSSNLFIADNVTLLLPFHMELDAIRENARSDNNKIGTTKSGIGPAYEDKVARRAIRLCDLKFPDYCKEKLEYLIEYHNIQRRHYGMDDLKLNETYDDLMKVAPKLLVFSQNVYRILNDAYKNNKNILFEGAQGTYLDVDHGTYPYVTSSNTLAGNATIGAGVGHSVIDSVIGVIKTYTTRVGSGSFPSELLDDVGKKLAKLGNEFGTVTGRSRRCGWLDIPMVRKSIMLNGCDSLAITKIDVLDSFEEIKVCTHYELDGVKIDYLPSSVKEQELLKPVYRSFKGWMSNTRDIVDFAKLPQLAKDYLAELEVLLQCPISMISTGPERNSTIIKKNPFKK